jgi:(5-formylfuran-3-yl)methyl phosphate synthase
MQLLVSLRSADEVAAALAGGADIVDAKEPALGSLGAVSSDVLAEIASRVPAAVPLSVALGDFIRPDAVRRAIRSVTLPRRIAPTYLKLGFAGARPNEVDGLVSAAQEAALAAPARPIIVPVAYADASRAAAPDPDSVLAATIDRGARAFLLDTWIKDGRGLLRWVDLGGLRALAARARSAGILFAVAGSLDPNEVARLGAVADVVGVRGAACRGGRDGAVDAELVRRLRRAVSPDERILANA